MTKTTARVDGKIQIVIVYLMHDYDIDLVYIDSNQTKNTDHLSFFLSIFFIKCSVFLANLLEICFQTNIKTFKFGPHVTRIRNVSKNMHRFISIISCDQSDWKLYRLDCFDKMTNFKQRSRTVLSPLAIGFEIKANSIRHKRNSDNPIKPKVLTTLDLSWQYFWNCKDRTTKTTSPSYKTKQKLNTV